MQKMLMTFVLFIYALAHLCAQKNPTKLPRTVVIDSMCSMDQTEVTIQDWIYFIINNDFRAELFPEPSSISHSTKMVFDDLRKGKGFDYIELINNGGYQKHYYGDNGFRMKRALKALIEADSNYFSFFNPIVGISFLQAQQYCQWRQNVVNTYKAVKIRITLPTIEMYHKVNPNKDSLCKAELKCDSCTGFQFNYAHRKCSFSTKKKEFLTQGQGLQRADSYWPSIEGLYNIQGNAAEMTSTPGIAVGGSFRHFAIESLRGNTQNYTKPEDWLGFRCFVSLQ